MIIEILYAETLNHAIECNMDISTITNLKEIHKQQIKRGFSWVHYDTWLTELNKIYLSNIREK